ncbi:MAG: hypothetical protein ABR529_10480 [Actinomycetota bacterium]
MLSAWGRELVLERLLSPSGDVVPLDRDKQHVTIEKDREARDAREV